MLKTLFWNSCRRSAVPCWLRAFESSSSIPIPWSGTGIMARKVKNRPVGLYWNIHRRILASHKQVDARRTKNSDKPVGPVDSTKRSKQDLKTKLKEIERLEDVED